MFGHLANYSAPGKTRVQTGFPARITSAYDSTFGYRWEMLVLDTNKSSPAVERVTNPATGNYAFCPDDDQTLTDGTEGWLEPDPLGQGWLFLRAGGSFSPTATSAALGSPTTINATDTTLVDLTINSAGWYVVTGTVDVSATMSAGYGYVGMWVRDETNSSNIIADSTLQFRITLPVTGVAFEHAMQYTGLINATSITTPATWRLHGQRSGSFTSCIAVATKTAIHALRIA